MDKHSGYKALDFFEAEQLGVTNPPRCNKCKNCRDCTFEAHQLSQETQRELDAIKGGLTVDPVKEQWVTQYPYKFDPSILLDNEEQADAILFKLEKQLVKNSKALRS